MRIISYKLENWGPHKAQSLSIPPEARTIALCGENDKGKSWIVRGIGFTLSIGRNEYGDQSSIHSGESQAYHQLLIEHNKATHKIEKIVHGKGSEEEGTITKINDKAVNKAEYEEFYKQTLGLPHPSIWLPICISMQNQTDFHLRSKKRDREEALRAICGLTKIDSWKDSLNQLYREEEKNLAQNSSKNKGIQEQILSELENLENKQKDCQKKLLRLQDHNKPEINWEDTLTLVKEFEDTLKEVSRKKLEKANVEKQISLLTNSGQRLKGEIDSLLKKVGNQTENEKERSKLKSLLSHIKETQLSKELENITKELKGHNIELLSLNPNDSEINLGDQENKLQEITKSIALLEQKINQLSELTNLLGLHVPPNNRSIALSIKNKEKVNQLISNALLEIKNLERNSETVTQGISNLCKVLKLPPEQITEDNDLINSTILAKELNNVARIVRNALKNHEHGSSSSQSQCPVCLSSISQAKLSQLTLEDQGEESDFNLKDIIELKAQTNRQREIKSQIAQWYKEFESKEAVEAQLYENNRTLKHLSELQNLLSNWAGLTPTSPISPISPISQDSKENVDIKNLIDLEKNNLLGNEKTLKEKIASFHKKTLLRSKVQSLEKEKERVTSQIEFFKDQRAFDQKELPNDYTLNLQKYDEEGVKKMISDLESLLEVSKAAQETIDKKNKELLDLTSQVIPLKNQVKLMNELLEGEEQKLAEGCGMPIPKDNGSIEGNDNLQAPVDTQAWTEINQEWKSRAQDCIKIQAVLSSINPRRIELKAQEKEIKLKLEEIVKSIKTASCARKVIDFLDYKNAPRKLLESIVSNLFEVTNRLGESLNVDIKLKLGKNLEFLTIQSRAGKWIEQKTERLGFGKGAILGICFRLACQKLLLPDIGFLILDEPTANVDLKRKGLFKLFLQNLSEDSQTRSNQIILIEHDEDVVELCQTKINIKEVNI